MVQSTTELKHSPPTHQRKKLFNAYTIIYKKEAKAGSLISPTVLWVGWLASRSHFSKASTHQRRQSSAAKWTEGESRERHGARGWAGCCCCYSSLSMKCMEYCQISEHQLVSENLFLHVHSSLIFHLTAEWKSYPTLSFTQQNKFVSMHEQPSQRIQGFLFFLFFFALNLDVYELIFITAKRFEFEIIWSRG
jgi:hypothetical protein